MKSEISSRSSFVRDYEDDTLLRDDGKNRFSDKKELEMFLDKKFIPTYISCRKIREKNSKEDICFSIQFNKILGLKCSNDEVKYIIEYLNQRNIRVGGHVSVLDGEFGNYDYMLKNNKSLYPECMEYEKQKLLFEELQLYKNTNNSRKNEIIKEIAEGSLRLIPYVTYNYSLFTGIDINELNSYGCEGLMLSIEKYNPNLGYKFSTFAISYIKNYVYKGLKFISGFDYDKKLYSSFVKFKNAVENGYSEDFGINMKITDDPKMINDVIELIKETYMLSPKREEILRNKIYMLYPESYEECTDLIFDYDMDEEIILKEKRDLIWKIFKSIPQKEKDILFKRYGFNGENIMTLEEIGKIYGISKQRVKQIENKAKSYFENVKY